jgi:hypothetical protein
MNLRFPTTTALAAALLAIGACFAAAPAAAQTATGAEPASPPAADASRSDASGNGELRRYCETANCRRNLRVVLRRDKGKTYDQTFELLPPAVQTGMISVHPGETVRAVPLFENGTFAGWREAKPDEPADTQILTIALSQSDKSAGMSAQVSTNTGPALKLRMGLIRLDGNDEPESTSSCPLMAGGFSSFEMWPYPIFVLLVADAKRPAADSPMVCE